MRIVIIVVTYNESGTISLVLDRLADVFKSIQGHDMHILVVDGNSPDGTADIVREKMKEYPFVHLLVEKEKEGLGKAYSKGFAYAMSQLHADAIGEMDADLQHDPNELPLFIREFDNGADYIIGSRFIKGGSIPKEWELKRKFFSVVGNFISKVVLGIFTLTDFTTGYKLSRVKGFVDQIDFDTLLSSGFSYKLDLLYRMHKLGAKIVEVPIKFGLRNEGISKMERNNIADSLRVIFTIRLRESAGFIKFCVVGFVGLFTDSSVFNLLRLTPVGSSYASLISGFVGMLTTFTLNNHWSFGDRKIGSAPQKVKSFGIYVGISYLPIIFRSFLIKYSVGLWGDSAIVSNGAFFVGISVGLIWNFFMYTRLIWKKN